MHKTRITQTVQVSLQTRWTLLVIIVPRHKKQDRTTHSVQLLRGNRPAASTRATTDVPRKSPPLIHTCRHRQKQERVNMRSHSGANLQRKKNSTPAPQQTPQGLCNIRKATHDYRYRKTRYRHYSIPDNPHPKPVPIHTKLPTHPP